MLLIAIIIKHIFTVFACVFWLLIGLCLLNKYVPTCAHMIYHIVRHQDVILSMFACRDLKTFMEAR
jgi:hypothetical protein